MFFIIENILMPEEVFEAQRLLNAASFLDGRATADVGYSVKNNLEMKVDKDYLSVVNLVSTALENSTEVNMRVVPRARTNPIVNRYDEGMYYHNHVDLPIQGGSTQMGKAPGRYGQNFLRTDYSMTLFLSHPESYEGGELALEIADELKLIKLPAGSAVFYSTGVYHAVQPVLSGSRVAAVCWFQSMFQNAQVRNLHWQQYCLERELQQQGAHDLADQASAVRNNLIRYLAVI
ncbi:Fe2+-dependent dioxygenase [Xenorhabdus anantnagensis]|uniref:Fe2+-dependent dioxygenase n=1 Tax=Xenorhabdus anantnagensis TaxID=3025875 RepID=A0ABT5M0H7_9GAMM|nr:Fe2+-dependent dioxygenase [Xenorhabdus anantnagensis]MDC9598819.1 Fe2+-dependent dioxygenase [Xenorhabdus anantnagensis]